MLFIRLPCGTTAEVTGPATYGRGSPASLSDLSISRQQVQLDPVAGLDDVLQLTNKGLNPIIVEVLQSSDAVASQQWKYTELLQKGESTHVGPNTRFYLSQRQCTTMFVLSNHETIAAAQQQEHQLQQQDKQQQPQHSLQHCQRQEQSAASATANAVHRHSNHDADAQLAAALAAQDRLLYHQQQLANDMSHDERPAKRARADSSATAVANTAGSADYSGWQPPAVYETPICLLGVRGLPAAFNAGCLGIQLRQLVCGALKFALVSNYMVDMAWLLSACPDLVTADKVIVVHGEKRKPAVVTAINSTAAAAGLTGPRFNCHLPPLPFGHGTHHTKAFILGYRGGGVRVIVMTANAIYPDCNNKTQGLWYQDFPPKAADAATAAAASDFETSLRDYVRALGMPGSWASELQDLLASHDFSSARVALVPSVPGYHSGHKLAAYGHMRLRSLLAATPLPARFKAAPVFMQCSSIGSLDENWVLREFMGSLTAGMLFGSSSDGSNSNAQAVAASGLSGAAATPQSSSADKAGRKAKGGAELMRQLTGAKSASSNSSVKPGSTAGVSLHFVWPTVSEVQHSREGWAAGGSIPGYSDKVLRPLLQRLWCRWGGQPVGRESAMPHIKSYGRFFVPTGGAATASPAAGSSPSTPAAAQLAANRSGSKQGNSDASSTPATTTAAAAAKSATCLAELAWWLVTSHNVSKAAWGVLQKGGGQLHIMSYELGVLTTPALEAAWRQHPHRSYCCPGGGPVAAAAATVAASISRPTSQASTSVDGNLCFYAFSKQHSEQQPAAPSLATRQATAPAAATHNSSKGANGGSGNRSADRGGSSNTSNSAAVYLPVPYRLPPEPYQDGDSPWCCDVDYPGVDTLGYTCQDAPVRNYGNTELPR